MFSYVRTYYQHTADTTNILLTYYQHTTGTRKTQHIDVKSAIWERTFVRKTSILALVLLVDGGGGHLKTTILDLSPKGFVECWCQKENIYRVFFYLAKNLLKGGLNIYCIGNIKHLSECSCLCCLFRPLKMVLNFCQTLRILRSDQDLHCSICIMWYFNAVFHIWDN